MGLELKKGDYVLMLDRLMLVSKLIDEHLQQHSVSKLDTEIKDHITKSSDQLFIATEKIKGKLNKDNTLI